MEQLPRLAHDAVSASSSAFHFVQKQRTLVLTTLTTGIEREKHHEWSSCASTPSVSGPMLKASESLSLLFIYSAKRDNVSHKKSLCSAAVSKHVKTRLQGRSWKWPHLRWYSAHNTQNPPCNRWTRVQVVCQSLCLFDVLPVARKSSYTCMLKYTVWSWTFQSFWKSNCSAATHFGDIASWVRAHRLSEVLGAHRFHESPWNIKHYCWSNPSLQLTLLRGSLTRTETRSQE